MGVRPGERVLVLLPNLPASVVVSLAIQHLGAISVEVARESGVDELAAVIEQCRPSCIAFTGRDVRKLAPLLRSAGLPRGLLVHEGSVPEGAFADLRGLQIAQVGEDGRLVSDDAPLPVDEEPVRDRAALAQLLYTSGSTGRPRGVMQTIGNIEANSSSIVEYLGLTARDRAMLILPLSYSYGRSVLQTHLLVGGSVFLDPRFMYPQVVLDSMASERCTGFAGVPLTFEILRRQTTPQMRELSALRYITQAGGALDPKTADWVRAAWAPARLFAMYGQTEATARLTYLPPERLDKHGSIGIPIPGVDMSVVDENGAELPVGTHGELVARGANVTPGYYGQPEESARILKNGRLHTGDVGYRDDEGYFYLVGREREILKVGGHRISPRQIETTLADCGGISEVAVCGAPDALMGEVPVALVVAEQGTALSEQEVRRFCASRLPSYMVPAVVRFTSALPRGPSGKLLRTEISRLLSNVQPQRRSVT
jgi:acyl-coenzyme A synthetase/AMP-(fatty) acid ligase